MGAWSAATTYPLNQGVSYLGSQYVSLQNGNLNQNPATATAYWALLSNGLMTMVDFSGDTVLVTATLGVNPYYLALNASGTTGYTLNSDKTVNSFDISTSLISSEVLESTLLPGANPASLFATSSATYISDTGVSAIDQLTSTPPALKQELPVAPAGTRRSMWWASRARRGCMRSTRRPAAGRGRWRRLKTGDQIRRFRRRFRWAAGRCME